MDPTFRRIAEDPKVASDDVYCSACHADIEDHAGVDALTGETSPYGDPIYFRICDRCARFWTLDRPHAKERKSRHKNERNGKPFVAKSYAPTAPEGLRVPCSFGHEESRSAWRLAVWCDSRSVILCGDCIERLRAFLAGDAPTKGAGGRE